MTSYIPLVFFLLAACTIFETKQDKVGCHRLISDTHMRNLSDLINSQMKTTCRHSFCYVDKKEFNNIGCFLRAASMPLLDILDQIEFKNNTPNFDKLKAIKDLSFQVGICVGNVLHNELCTKRFLLTAEEMLLVAQDYLSEAKRFLLEGNFSQDCSSIFEKCSDCQEKEGKEFAGVATDQDCPCLAPSPNSGGDLDSFLPASESSSSIVDQLDNKETADSIQQLFVLPDTTQIQGMAGHSTRSRLLRSTQMVSQATESVDFRADTDMVMFLPAEEQSLAAVSQKSDSGSMNALSFLDPDITLDRSSHQHKNIPLSISGEQHIESLETKSPLADSGAGSSLAWPNELLSQHAHLFDLAKSSLSMQWLQTGEMNEAITGLVTDGFTSGASRTPSLTLSSTSGLKPVDGSRLSSSGSWLTLAPGDPRTLYHVLLDSKDPISATRQPPRLVASTDSPSFLRLISPESGSWGEEGKRGRSLGGQQSTQLRERRAERDEGLAQDWEPAESMLGPGFDLSFIPPNTDRHVKKPGPSEARGTAVIYVAVPSVLGILLAVGGLLFYLHKSRSIARRQLQRNESNMERPEEGRPLNNEDECVELQIQETL